MALVCIPVLVISLAVLAVHGSLVRENYGQVHWEDTLFWDHRDEHIHSFADCWQTPLWPGLYRPLSTTCYYYVVGLFSERSSAIHHVINVLLYIANGLLLFVYARRFLPSVWALAAGVLYVSRSAHSEILTNSVEFQALSAVFFMFLSLIWFEKSREQRKSGWQLPLSCLALVLALLSKEITVVAPVLMLAAGWFSGRRLKWRSYLAPLAVIVVWAVLFVTVLRSLSDYAPTGFSYSYAPMDLVGNYSVYLFSFANLLAYVPDNRILPERLQAVAHTELAYLVVVLLLVITAVLAFFHRHVRWMQAERLRSLGFALAFFFVATAPFVILEERAFMRYSYPGHAGLAMAGAVLLQSVVGTAWLYISRGRVWSMKPTQG
jgi:hypothetical protein